MIVLLQFKKQIEAILRMQNHFGEGRDGRIRKKEHIQNSLLTP